MATAVTIQIMVDGSGAVSGLKQVETGLADIGNKGAVSLGQASAAVDKLGGHVSTSLDGVRLMSQEFGFRMPRALEAMASRIPGITNAIQGMMGAFTGIAIAEILYRVGDAAYNLYEKYLDVGAAARKYNEEVTKASDVAFGNSRSIEDTTMRIQIAAQQLREYKKAADDLNASPSDVAKSLATSAMMGGPLGLASGVSQYLMNRNDATKAAGLATDAQRTLDLLAQKQQIEQSHAIVELQIEAQHAADGRLGSEQKITAEAQKQIQLHAETRRYNNALDAALGNPVSPVSGAAEEGLQNAVALGKASDAQVALYRKERDERITAQNDAVNAGLDGDAKLEAEKLQSIQKVQLRYLDQQLTMRTADAITASLSEKFDNERALRFQTQYNAALKSSRDAQAAGLRGPNKAYAEYNNRLADISGENADPQTKALEATTAKAELDQKLSALDQEYRDQLTVAQQKTADAAMRIEDQETNYAKQAAEAQRRVKSASLLGWVSDYKDAVAAIEAQNTEEMAKLDKLRVDEKLSDEQYAQAKVNIDRTANAQVTAQNQQLQHQIASTLESAFSDPIGFIKRKMEQMFFDIIAAWIMRMQIFKNLFGTTMGGLQPGAAGGAGAAQGGIAGALGGLVRGTFSGHPTAPPPSSNDGPFVPPVLHGADGSVISSSFMGGGSTGGASSLPPGFGGSFPGTGGTGGAIPTFPGGSTSSGAQGNPALSTAGSLAGVGLGGYLAFQSTRSAYESGTGKGTLRGAIGDAEAGAMIGSAFGPAGALIGGAVGAIGGSIAGLVGHLTGEGGNLAAREYYRKTLFPEIEAERNSMGGGNFQTAISQINKSASDGMEYMSTHYGSNAAAWVNANYLRKEQQYALSEIERRAQGGGAYVQRAAAQFHSGGTITGFGDLATSSTEGFVHAMLSEKVVNPWASAVHGGTIDAMNGGASPSDIASRYLAASARPSSSGASAAAGDTHNWTVNALDPKSFQHFLRNGGSRQIVKQTNSFGGKYAGDGVAG